jgi:PTH1 family peptidyl-tRNA hydrolase
MAKLIVALGNPGKEYEFTRHNIAWLVSDQLPISQNNIWKEKFKGTYVEAQFESEKIYLLKPLTYMNLSGESVQPMMAFFKIAINDLIVIHDELDLAFGRINFKLGGGLAGHNGLKSIAKHLGSQDFMRLRIGIGRPIQRSVSDWVLSSFYDQTDSNLETVFNYATSAIEYYLQSGFKKATDRYNNRNILEEK